MSTVCESEVSSVCTAQSEKNEPFLHSVNGSTSWWVVSVLLHVLVIALAAIVSIAIKMPSPDDTNTVVIVTEFSKPPELIEPIAPEPPLNHPTAGEAKYPGQGTSNEPSDVLITDEMRRLATLSNENETINLNRPDTHDAAGIRDANIIYDATGHDGDKGGGGTGGPGMSDLIGLDGAGSVGSGGGFGGGRGLGTGPDDGNGFASRGNGGGGRNQRIKDNGGSDATIRGMNDALRWLAYHQEADGHWDTMKFGSSQKTDTAMTGMALLAFVGAGHTEKSGAYKDSVRRAVTWLKSKQQANGLIFDPSDAGAHRGIGYPTAIATLAIVEAGAMSRDKQTTAAAQKAIDYCVEVHQCGEGSEKLGWRYNPKQASDTSVTGWFVMALKSAKIAGLRVDDAALHGALDFLKSVEFKNDGGDSSYGSAVHYGYQPGSEHADSTHRLTAIGSLIRIFMGASKEQVLPSVEWFVNKGGVPSWGANGEMVDMYYWYYGSLCTYQVNGPLWDRWNTGLIKALTENQCKQGDDAGSWPIVGAFSSEWGRVGQTALGCLSYEVYVRYGRKASMKK